VAYYRSFAAPTAGGPGKNACCGVGGGRMVSRWQVFRGYNPGNPGRIWMRCKNSKMQTGTLGGMRQRGVEHVCRWVSMGEW
jgi:hypothetical protein